MFEQLQERLEGVFRSVTGNARLTDENTQEALREIRRALLAADVEVNVAKAFVARVKERALGVEVTKGVAPGQHVVKVVHDELVTLLGRETAPLALTGPAPHVILVMGLQGSGKTTFCAKLAKHLAGQGRRPGLVACDLQRPAAIDQLEALAAQVEVPVYAQRSTQDVVAVAKAAASISRERCSGVWGRLPI